MKCSNSKYRMQIRSCRIGVKSFFRNLLTASNQMPPAPHMPPRIASSSFFVIPMMGDAYYNCGFMICFLLPFCLRSCLLFITFPTDGNQWTIFVRRPCLSFPNATRRKTEANGLILTKCEVILSWAVTIFYSSQVDQQHYYHDRHQQFPGDRETPNLDRLARPGMLFSRALLPQSDLHADPCFPDYRALSFPARRVDARHQAARMHSDDRRLFK